MQNLQCTLGVQNLKLSHVQHEIWDDIITFLTYTDSASGVDAQVYSLHLYMLYTRHALIHVHRLSCKIHPNSLLEYIKFQAFSHVDL
jgi:hypothetical protein